MSRNERSLTVGDLRRMKASGERIAALTAYDATFSRLMDQAGVDLILVGDSLGMVIQGHESTLPVTLDQMVYHGACVSHGSQRALRVIDMPFLSYSTSKQALESAQRLIQQGSAHVVKLEGGRERLEVVSALVREGIPVCGHLGLLPQSYLKLGGYPVQGRSSEDAKHLLEDARLMEDAGVSMMVLECIPSRLAGEITSSLAVPTIGIGAGPDCDGQVLVSYDLLGCSLNTPSFCFDFLAGEGSVFDAFHRYVQAVKSGSFPTDAHGFK